MALTPRSYAAYLQGAARPAATAPAPTQQVADPWAALGIQNPYAAQEAPPPPPTNFVADTMANMAASKDSTDAMMYRGVQEFAPVRGIKDWAARRAAINQAEAQKSMQRISPEGRAALEGMQWQGGWTGGFKDPSVRGFGMAIPAALANVPTMAGIAAGGIAGVAGAPVAGAALASGLAAGIPGGLMGSGDAAQQAETQGATPEQAHEAAVAEFLPSFAANSIGSAVEAGQVLKAAKSLKTKFPEGVLADPAKLAEAAKAVDKADLLKRTAVGTLTEGLTEGGEAASTAMAVNAALNKPLVDENVVNNAIGEGVVAMGAGLGTTAATGAGAMALQKANAAMVNKALQEDDGGDVGAADAGLQKEINMTGTQGYSPETLEYLKGLGESVKQAAPELYEKFTAPGAILHPDNLNLGAEVFQNAQENSPGAVSDFLRRVLDSVEQSAQGDEEVARQKTRDLVNKTAEKMMDSPEFARSWLGTDPAYHADTKAAVMQTMDSSPELFKRKAKDNGRLQAVSKDTLKRVFSQVDSFVKNVLPAEDQAAAMQDFLFKKQDKLGQKDEAFSRGQPAFAGTIQTILDHFGNKLTPESRALIETSLQENSNGESKNEAAQAPAPEQEVAEQPAPAAVSVQKPADALKRRPAAFSPFEQTIRDEAGNKATQLSLFRTKATAEEARKAKAPAQTALEEAPATNEVAPEQADLFTGAEESAAPQVQTVLQPADVVSPADITAQAQNVAPEAKNTESVTEQEQTAKTARKPRGKPAAQVAAKKEADFRVQKKVDQADVDANAEEAEPKPADKGAYTQSKAAAAAAQVDLAKNAPAKLLGDVLARLDNNLRVRQASSEQRGESAEKRAVRQFHIDRLQKAFDAYTANRSAKNAEALQKVYDQTTKFSRADSAETTGTQVHHVVRALKIWPFIGKRQVHGRVRIVQSVENLRVEVGKPEIKDNTKGLYHKGRVYLVADLIKDDADARGTLLHELGAHFGFSMREVRAFAKEVKAWGDAKEGTLQRRVYDETMARMENAGIEEGHKLFDEELVAYAVETAYRMGANPATKVGNWMQRLITWLKGFFGAKGMTPEELVTYAQAAMEKATPSVKAYDTLESVANPKEIYKAVKETSVGKVVGDVLSKSFETLGGQLQRHMNGTPLLVALRKRLYTAVKQYHEGRILWKYTLFGHFKEHVEFMAKLTHSNPEAYKQIYAALESEKPLAELHESEWHDALSASYKVGKVTRTGYDLLTSIRNEFQKMVRVAANQGVFIFNDITMAEKILQGEATYFPRMIDVSKLEKYEQKMVDALAGDKEIRKEMGWGNEETARLKARAFVDALRTRGYDDAILNAISGYNMDDAVTRASKLLLSGETFSDDDTKLAVILARAFAHKNKRVLKDSVVEVMREVYQKDLSIVTLAYTSALGTRIATHQNFGGYVKEDFSEYSNKLHINEAKENTAFEVLKKKYPERPDWALRALAKEEVAQAGKLYYSPVAYAEFILARAYRESQGKDGLFTVHDKNWFQGVFFPAQFNTLGQDINPIVRNTQDALLLAMKIPTLSLATITSWVEIGSVASRVYNPAIGRSMMGSTARALALTLKHIMTSSGREEMRRAMTDVRHLVGITADSTVQYSVLATDSDKIASPLIRKLTSGYFHGILLSKWTNIMSVVAAKLAAEEIDHYISLDNAASRKEMQAINLTAEQWAKYKADPLAADATIEQQTAHVQEHQAVYKALHSWINGARLHPTPLTRTGWGNNPKWLLFWTLNDFPYTFGATTFRRLANIAAMHPTTIGKSIPFIMSGIVFTMLGMMSMAMKDMIKGEPPEDLLMRANPFVGPSAMLGPYERIVKIGQHIGHDYQGNPFLMNISLPISSAFSVNQVGLTQTMINQASFLSREHKKEFMSWFNAQL